MLPPPGADWVTPIEVEGHPGLRLWGSLYVCWPLFILPRGDTVHWSALAKHGGIEAERIERDLTTDEIAAAVACFESYRRHWNDTELDRGQPLAQWQGGVRVSGGPRTILMEFKDWHMMLVLRTRRYRRWVTGGLFSPFLIRPLSTAKVACGWVRRAEYP